VLCAPCGASLLPGPVTNALLCRAVRCSLSAPPLRATALIFPICVTIIRKENINPYAALYVLLFGASSNYSTPLGYQTNLMVHAPGGYKFFDWVKYGLAVQILQGFVSVFAINHFHPTSR
jgi:di/tricarboxylate transporter